MIDQIKKKYCCWGDYLKIASKGFCMGVADIIPGISGGTIAFLLGIYEELIVSIKSFDITFVKLLLSFRFKEALARVAWQFLGALFFGIIGSILILSEIISWLLSNQPVLTYSFFFGLIVATVPIIARIIKQWTLSKILTVGIAAVVTYLIVGLVPMETPQSMWFLFLCGALCISAMILPGISGAFILVLLGKYQFILDAISHRDFLSIGIFVSGIVIGILGFVRVLGWLFAKYHDITVTIITGIVIGSLRKIWPWKEIVETLTTSHGKIIPIKEINIFPEYFSGNTLVALIIAGLGFALALFLNRSPNKNILS